MKFDLNQAVAIAQPIVAKYAALFGRRYGLGEQDREELKQEMFVGVVRRWHRHDASRGELGAFLTAVIKNRGRSVLRLLRRMRSTCRGRVPMEGAAHEKAPACEPTRHLEVREAVDQALVMRVGRLGAEVLRLAE